MAIDPKFIIKLKNKEYPTWPGVLSAATEAGLKSLTTRVLQVPSPENGQMAVVMARAEFDDGRVFEDLGDCSPASTSAQLASAALRLASTRAKGRCLRDAINVGQTMFEELPGGDERDDAPPEPQPKQKAAARRDAEPIPPPIACDYDGCGSVLTGDEVKAALHYAEAFDGKKFCKTHGAPLVTVWKAKQEEAKSDPFQSIPEAA